MANNKRQPAPVTASPGPQPTLTLAVMLKATSQGLTRQDVADLTGACYQSVCIAARKFKSQGVDLKREHGGVKTDVTVKAIIELWIMQQTGEGSIGSIADLFGVTPQRISQIKGMVKDMGVEL